MRALCARTSWSAAFALGRSLRYNGGEYGPRNSSLASGCADPDHHYPRAALALTGAGIMPEVLMVGTSDVYTENEPPVEISTSGVAWPAIIGGAFAAIALTLILL